MLVLVLWLQKPIFAWSFHNGPRIVGQLQSSVLWIPQEHARRGRSSTGVCHWPCLGHMATSAWVVAKEKSNRTVGERAPVWRVVGGGDI